MSLKSFLSIFLFGGFMLLGAQTVSAQKKTIHVTPETAKIFVNGAEVGTGTYTLKFKRGEDFVMLKFEAPGYLPRTVRLFKDNPSKTLAYSLYQDEAMMQSSGADEGIDIANKNVTITVREGMSEDVVWKRMMNIAVMNFENIEMRDKDAGWIRTAWINTRFSSQVVRTRLEIRQTFAGEGIAYQVKISSEISDDPTCSGSQCFEKYDRVLKKYENIISELQTTLGSNL